MHPSGCSCSGDLDPALSTWPRLCEYHERMNFFVASFVPRVTMRSIRLRRYCATDLPPGARYFAHVMFPSEDAIVRVRVHGTLGMAVKTAPRRPRADQRQRMRPPGSFTVRLLGTDAKQILYRSVTLLGIGSSLISGIVLVSF